MDMLSTDLNPIEFGVESDATDKSLRVAESAR